MKVYQPKLKAAYEGGYIFGVFSEKGLALAALRLGVQGELSGGAEKEKILAELLQGKCPGYTERYCWEIVEMEVDTPHQQSW